MNTFGSKKEKVASALNFKGLGCDINERSQRHMDFAELNA